MQQGRVTALGVEVGQHQGSALSPYLFLLLVDVFDRGCEKGPRGSRGIAAPLGMSAHPIIGGSAYYLALKLCHKVAHNPNIDLLILTFACTRKNKKLYLKMFF